MSLSRALPLTGSGVKGSSDISVFGQMTTCLGFGSFICKPGVVVVFASQSCCED